jgi:recombination protein RecA
MFDIMYGEGISRWGELVDLGSAARARSEERKLVLLSTTSASARAATTPSIYPVEHPDDRRPASKQEIRENFYKLQGSTSAHAADRSPASKPVDVSADDFNDEN